MYYIIRELNGHRYYASTDVDWKWLSDTVIKFKSRAECQKFMREYIWEKDAKMIWHT